MNPSEMIKAALLAECVFDDPNNVLTTLELAAGQNNYSSGFMRGMIAFRNRIFHLDPTNYIKEEVILVIIDNLDKSGSKDVKAFARSMKWGWARFEKKQRAMTNRW